MVLERSIYSDFVFLEAMYRQGFIRKQCESAAGWPCGHGGGFVKVLLDPPCSWHMFCKRLLLISRRMMPFLRESQSLPTPSLVKSSLPVRAPAHGLPERPVLEPPACSHRGPFLALGRPPSLRESQSLPTPSLVHNKGQKWYGPNRSRRY